MLLNNNIIAFNNFIVVVCITAVVSALLTLSQTFQGYGPPGLPIVIFLPLVTMISLAILPVLFELPYGSILVFVISLELFIQLCFATYYLVRRFISCYDSARSLPMGIISSSFRFSNSNSFAKVLQAFEFLVTSHYATPSTIVSLGIHYQSMIEAAELYRQKLLDIEHPNIVPRSKSHPLIPAWRALDNIKYGWRMDQIAFDLSPQVLGHMMPDFILFNPSRYNWLRSSLKGQSIKLPTFFFLI